MHRIIKFLVIYMIILPVIVFCVSCDETDTTRMSEDPAVLMTANPVVRNREPEAVDLDNKVPKDMREFYFKFCNALEKQYEEIVFLADITHIVNSLVYYADKYNPHLFYVDWNEYKVKTQSLNNKVVKTTIIMNYKNNRTNDDIDLVESKVNKIIAEADKKESLFEKELFIHDYLVENTSYSFDSEHSGDIYGALIEGKAKCEGYAKAFQYIMNRIGAETVLITGKINENRVWNMIKLYDNYYYVDTAHDDIMGEDDFISHSCFNVSDDVIKATHEIFDKTYNYDLMECKSDDYNYYNVKGLTASDINEYRVLLETKILSEYKKTGTSEVFFTDEMPPVNQLSAVFEETIKSKYPDKSYNFNYNTENDFSYKRKVFLITWDIR